MKLKLFIVLQTVTKVVGILAIVIGVLLFTGGSVRMSAVDGPPIMFSGIVSIIEGVLVLCALHCQHLSYFLPVLVIYVRF
jgi:uncharacterized membrane protein HdeD (DUF308 family)